jgi:hypothetical protein
MLGRRKRSSAATGAIRELRSGIYAAGVTVDEEGYHDSLLALVVP